jgi:hypothetical protein
MSGSNSSTSLEIDLNEKIIKINKLEEELEKKNSFINHLLISKNELLNFNFKNILSPSSIADSANGNSLDLNESSLEDSYDVGHLVNSGKKPGCYYNDYFSLKEEYIELKKQILFIEIAVNKFLE